MQGFPYRFRMKAGVMCGVRAITARSSGVSGTWANALVFFLRYCNTSSLMLGLHVVRSSLRRDQDRRDCGAGRGYIERSARSEDIHCDTTCNRANGDAERNDVSHIANGSNAPFRSMLPLTGNLALKITEPHTLRPQLPEICRFEGRQSTDLSKSVSLGTRNCAALAILTRDRQAFAPDRHSYGPMTY